VFVDSARIRVRAGDGGNGCVSFRREKFIPRGGPDGGDGGDGGDVILAATEGYKTLLDCQQQHYYKAGQGAHGSGSNKHGKNGATIVVPVPPGTLVTDQSTGEVLVDLIRPGDTLTVAKGGKGGRGNATFKSSTNRAPRRFERGRPGEAAFLLLTLKVLADIALVGLPNAGKSTLISAISAAQPKIGNYPFTTRAPNLGTINADNVFSYTIADIPGLVEGAHTGKGLGTRFLQHVQRAEVLVLVLDVSDAALAPAADACRILFNEMSQFEASLPDRVAFATANKTDLECSPSTMAGVREFCRERDIHLIELSALTGEGLEEFVAALSSRMSRMEPAIGS